MSKLELFLEDEAAQLRLAGLIASKVGPGCVIFLQGDLGAGKTTLVRGFLQALGFTGNVKSPTYTLVEPYQVKGQMIYHFDLYRLKTADEIIELGFEEAINDGITLVEWPDRLGPYLPRDRLEVELAPGPSENARRARLTGYSYWQARMTDAFLDGKIHA